MICIGVGTNDKLHSRIIRWVTESDVSHVWIEYQSAEWGGWWAAHSTDRGVIKETLGGVEERYPRHRRYRCNADLTSGLLAARGYIGRADYDYAAFWNLILLVLYKLTKWEWLWGLVSHNTAKLTCSEFIAIILKESGVGVFDPELTLPKDVDEFCADSRYFSPAGGDSWPE